MKIKKVIAREVIDSRALPTVEVKVTLESGVEAKDAVPSGASTGTKEALELRDGNIWDYEGKGVQKACSNIEEIIFPAIKNINVFDQKKIDQTMKELDGTENKSRLGANAILAVSMATCRAAALEKKLPLWKYIRKTYGFKKTKGYGFPVPMMNVINGGKHADSGLDLQEYMLVPSGLPTFAKRLKAGAEIYHHYLSNILLQHGYRIAVGDEGGFAPTLQSNQEALQLLEEAIKKSPYQLGKEIKIGLDAAASEFFDQENNKYELKLDGISLEGNQLGAMYRDWISKYPIELIEDPMSEFDWESWTKLTSNIGSEITIIGDDLTVTNNKILEEAIERKACNAVLIKINQIGTLSETIETIKLGQAHNFKIAVSHRSGEPTDDFIADLAVAVQADYVKFGAPARGERVCKYNRVAEIEREYK